MPGIRNWYRAFTEGAFCSNRSEDTYYGQVHRNVVYNISATIAGNGYADPTLPKGDPTADLFVKTMVMNWGTATQAPVIE